MSFGSSTAPVHVVYVGGFGRSGSTLLERILGAIPGWANVGELVDLPRSVWPQDELCGCGERFSACPLWLEVGEIAFGGWSEDTMNHLADLRIGVARQRHLPALLALASGRARASHLAQVRDYQQAYGRIYQAVAQASGASVVVDASKGPAHGLALAAAPDPSFVTDRGYGMSMVNLVRDPRGVAYSWSRRTGSRPQAGATNTEMWTISPTRSAAQWAALQTEMQLVARPIESHRVRYEDLVAHPRATVRGLLERLGLAAVDGGLDHLEEHAVTLTSSHGLSGNPSRFRNGRIDLELDEQWARDLPAGERRTVTALTLPWLTAYGYDVRPRPSASTSGNPQGSGAAQRTEHPS
ncbi:sulfotransferase family protein [Nocardioides sp.]|uniref:sulfotransferase family protein n=1 Tax=Nocardioides sp. TaxID=35761 RepID=UPI003D13C947